MPLRKNRKRLPVANSVRHPLREHVRGKFEDYAEGFLMPSLFKIFWELRKPQMSAIVRKSRKVSARHNNVMPILSASLTAGTIFGGALDELVRNPPL